MKDDQIRRRVLETLRFYANEAGEFEGDPNFEKVLGGIAVGIKAACDASIAQLQKIKKITEKCMPSRAARGRVKNIFKKAVLMADKLISAFTSAAKTASSLTMGQSKGSPSSISDVSYEEYLNDLYGLEDEPDFSGEWDDGYVLWWSEQLENWLDYVGADSHGYWLGVQDHIKQSATGAAAKSAPVKSLMKICVSLNNVFD